MLLCYMVICHSWKIIGFEDLLEQQILLTYLFKSKTSSLAVLHLTKKRDFVVVNFRILKRYLEFLFYPYSWSFCYGERGDYFYLPVFYLNCFIVCICIDVLNKTFFFLVLLPKVHQRYDLDSDASMAKVSIYPKLTLGLLPVKYIYDTEYRTKVCTTVILRLGLWNSMESILAFPVWTFLICPAEPSFPLPVRWCYWG